jgi:hypothetical protein
MTDGTATFVFDAIGTRCAPARAGLGGNRAQPRGVKPPRVIAEHALGEVGRPVLGPERLLPGADSLNEQSTGLPMSLTHQRYGAVQARPGVARGRESESAGGTLAEFSSHPWLNSVRLSATAENADPRGIARPAGPGIASLLPC